eukprot:13018740-Heterocapsa_arctica.AAC.1
MSGIFWSPRSSRTGESKCGTMPWISKSATATIGRVTLDTTKSKVIWTPCQVVHLTVLVP